MEKIPLIAVVGPTASGKTRLGIELAKAFGGEIISADSMQIYKGISIASAAPTKEEMQGVPYHLIEFLDRDDAFSVADYVNLAHKTIREVYSRNKLPILVGGTGLYVNSLTEGIEFVESDTDEELRKKLQKEMDEKGSEAMLEKLREIDPDTAAALHPNNRRRIIRALEIYYSTGITFSRQNELSRKNDTPYNTTFIGITYRDREKLYERINKRVDIMLENGLLSEAETTLNEPAGKGAAQAIGHKELHKYLRGEASLTEAVETLKRETRRYAKRQLTWFRRNENINWLYADYEDVYARAKEIVKGGISRE